MSLTYRTHVAIASALVLSALAAPALAQSSTQPLIPSPPHVRATGDTQVLLDEALRRSSAIRALYAQLEALDVTVYVRSRVFTQTSLEGRIGLIGVTGSRRYLLIELSCVRTRVSQMASLGHELFHAVEIASDPSVVDAASLAALYERIGIQTGEGHGALTFETEAAANAGLRARREVLSRPRADAVDADADADAER